MPILKCKICGGDMEVSPDKSFGTCEYCGTTMTLPKIDDEQRAAAFNRGNHFRRTGEFDKALQVYERIITEDPNDAEAHWCCALCRYGIEWVEDPATMEYLPTCHRASFDIFTDDIDCKAAIELSDGVTKRQYQKDAVKIADVQKGILLTSQKEEPFDVFICYKETDENGNRTVDSTLAQDVYYQLTDKGLRVFFARITLEDKAGSQYEPYIFAALHSAKVMVVIGTRPEHFSAVWVKNEWSRFLSLVKKDHSKALLPCYKDMDPYDLPEQLAVLQSYDMSKIGFIQDLIRGIEKIAKADKPKAAVKEPMAVGGGSVSIAPLLKRAFIFLEDGEWQEADDYCEKVLDQDPENAQAYLGKLMAELQVKKQENLKDAAQPFDKSNNYQKILRFGDDAIKEKLKSDIAYISERNEQKRISDLYNDAFRKMNAADSEAAYKEAAETFQTIPGFKDADNLATECLEKAEVCRQKAEEQRAAEEARQRELEQTVDAMATAIQKKASNGTILTPEQQLEQQRPLLSELQALLPSFDEKLAKFQKLTKESQDIEQKILSLREQRNNLGFFAGKQKKEIDEAIKNHSDVKSATEREIRALSSELRGFTAKNQLEVRIEQIKERVSNLEKKIGTTIRLSYEQAFELYWRDDALRRSFDAKYPHSKEVLKTIVFGHYRHSTLGAFTPIEWTILDGKDGKVLLLSRYALDCQPYNASEADVTWETCSLRKWLNDSFFNIAFSKAEQSRIQSTTVTADKNPEYITLPGNDTIDKVFLLSIPEVKKYFSSDEARKCAPTAYAKAQRADTNPSNGNCWWWLRSPGKYSYYAAGVSHVGSVGDRGDRVDSSGGAVRPAMWISLD